MKDLLNTLNESGMVWFYITALVSADSILTVEDCDRSIDLLQQTIEALPETNIDKEEQDKIREYCFDGIEICENDKKNFLKNIN